jgi:hypothetical protein
MDLSNISGIGDALQNFEGLVAKYNAQVNPQELQAGDTLPSVKDLVHMMHNPVSEARPQGTLSGGKRAISGGSKKSKRSSRSRRADLRERYRLSPKKRAKRKAKRSKK